MNFQISTNDHLFLEFLISDFKLCCMFHRHNLQTCLTPMKLPMQRHEGMQDDLYTYSRNTTATPATLASHHTMKIKAKQECGTYKTEQIGVC